MHAKNKAEMTAQNDPLLKQAECLVEVAQINAIALYQSARTDFLFLRDMNVNHWESILTIAGIFVAANRLKNLRLNEQREQILMKPSVVLKTASPFLREPLTPLRATTSDLLHLMLSVHGSS